eukprot:4357490-Pyramimonas_sp.AAC.1
MHRPTIIYTLEPRHAQPPQNRQPHDAHENRPDPTSSRAHDVLSFIYRGGMRHPRSGGEAKLANHILSGMELESVGRNLEKQVLSDGMKSQE